MTTNLLISFLRLLGVKHTTSFSTKHFAEHPHKYNLFGLSSMLSDYKINNAGIKVTEKNDITNIEPPFIAHIGSDFAIVEKIDKNLIHFVEGGKKIKTTTDEFIKKYIKTYCILSILLTLLLISCGKPSASDILRRSYDKCQSIENGYYEMDLQLKMLSNIDTFNISHSSYFKKMPEDAIYTYLFHSKLSTTFRDTGASNINILYTGSEVYHYTDDPESLIYREADIFKIKNVYVKNPSFTTYQVITNSNSNPLLNDIILEQGRDNISIELIGNDVIENRLCYHIRAELNPEYDLSTIGHYSAGLEYNYWISKDDYLPVQFTIQKNYFINNDSVNEFSKYRLKYYDFNNLSDYSIFTISSLPYPDRISEDEVEVTDFLKKGNVVPEWEIKTSGGEVFNQSNAPKLTILNFFYASCPPCIELHPFLDQLNDEFQSKGLQVLGLSHVDTFSNLDYFKDRHKINHTIGRGSEQLFIDFGVLAYPTIFLINQDGVIIHKSVGLYDESGEKELREIIIENL